MRRVVCISSFVIVLLFGRTSSEELNRGRGSDVDDVPKSTPSMSENQRSSSWDAFLMSLLAARPAIPSQVNHAAPRSLTSISDKSPQLQNKVLSNPFPGSPSVALPDDSHLRRLCRLSHSLIDTALMESTTDDMARDQMGTWLPCPSVRQIRGVLEETRFEPNTVMGNFIVSSPIPIVGTLYKSEEFELTLLHAPPRMETPGRRHSPGTVLLYVPLYGEGTLKSVVEKRVIQENSFVDPPVIFSEETEDSMNSLSEDEDEECNPSLYRIGGPNRIFESSSHRSGAAILELAIYSPRRYPTIIGAKEARAALGPPSSGPANGWLSKVSAWAGEKLEADEKLEEEEESSAALKLALVEEDGHALLEGDDLLISSEEQGKRLSKDVSGLQAKHEKYAIGSSLSSRVGGLSGELDKIVSKVLLSRQLKPSTLKELGLSHVKGLLLHGPPGTGKTLIARELARALNAREPVIVNGPEIMDKYIGEAERNIRDLFKPAEDELEKRGEESELHVIVFDEFDSIAKARGNMVGDGSGTRDSVVNQLLAKLDGVNEMSNVLIVALTNRKDLIDPALLRPGRLEVHVRIEAPKTVEQREDIMQILLRPMVDCGRLRADEADQIALSVARRTRGFTGAELAGILRSAGSLALGRYFDSRGRAVKPDLPAARSGKDTEVEVGGAPGLVVTEEDMLRAVDEAKYSQGRGNRVMRLLRKLRRSVSK